MCNEGVHPLLLLTSGVQRPRLQYRSRSHSSTMVTAGIDVEWQQADPRWRQLGEQKLGVVWVVWSAGVQQAVAIRVRLDWQINGNEQAARSDTLALDWATWEITHANRFYAVICMVSHTVMHHLAQTVTCVWGISSHATVMVHRKWYVILQYMPRKWFLENLFWGMLFCISHGLVSWSQ